MNTFRKAKVTDEHREEAAKLRAIWDSRPHETQAEFGEKYGIGNQSAVGQFLNARIPLNMKAASGFARGLKCSISDFSPRIANKNELLRSSFDEIEQQLRAGSLRVDEGESYPKPARLLYLISPDKDGKLPDGTWLDYRMLRAHVTSAAFVATDDDDAFLFEVAGISMVPRYNPGEIILVEPNTRPRTEDDVLIRLQTGEVMLRRLASTHSGIQLSSYNDPAVLGFASDAVSWMYHVAHRVPRSHLHPAPVQVA
jgi:hypothetical protein